MRRPAFLSAPGAVLRVIAGRELADEALLASQRVEPEALSKQGFEFRHPALGPALADALG